MIWSAKNEPNKTVPRYWRLSRHEKMPKRHLWTPSESVGTNCSESCWNMISCEFAYKNTTPIFRLRIGKTSPQMKSALQHERQQSRAPVILYECAPHARRGN